MIILYISLPKTLKIHNGQIWLTTDTGAAKKDLQIIMKGLRKKIKPSFLHKFYNRVCATNVEFVNSQE